MFVVIVCVVALAGLAFASYLLLVLLHELGHGLAALALARGEVAVYVGSYQQAGGCWHLRLGRLHLHLLRQPWRWWRGGCCAHQLPRRAWQEALIGLAGPLVPAALGLAAFALSLRGPNGGWRIAAFVFVLVAGGSLLQNLFGGRPIRLPDGRRWRSDGQLLWQLLRHPGRHHLPTQALALVQAGRYAEAARHYEQLLHHHGPAAELCRVLLHCYQLAGRPVVALSISRQFEQELPTAFTDDDRFMRGNLLLHLGRHRQAVAAYGELLQPPTPYPAAYNNRGYTYLLLKEYARALPDFDQAIAHDASRAFAYNNRGLARLRLGHPAAEARADLDEGLRLDPTNAYAHRNLGIWHYEQQQYPLALASLKQAHALDPATPELDWYLHEVRRQLPQAQGS